MGTVGDVSIVECRQPAPPPGPSHQRRALLRASAVCESFGGLDGGGVMRNMLNGTSDFSLVLVLALL